MYALQKMTDGNSLDASSYLQLWFNNIKLSILNS